MRMGAPEVHSCALARATLSECVRTISSNMYKIGSTLSPQAGWIYYRSVSENSLT